MVDGEKDIPDPDGGTYYYCNTTNTNVPDVIKECQYGSVCSTIELDSGQKLGSCTCDNCGDSQTETRECCYSPGNPNGTSGGTENTIYPCWHTEENNGNPVIIIQNWFNYDTKDTEIDCCGTSGAYPTDASGLPNQGYPYTASTTYDVQYVEGGNPERLAQCGSKNLPTPKVICNSSETSGELCSMTCCAPNSTCVDGRCSCPNGDIDGTCCTEWGGLDWGVYTDPVTQEQTCRPMCTALMTARNTTDPIFACPKNNDVFTGSNSPTDPAKFGWYCCDTTNGQSCPGPNSPASSDYAQCEVSSGGVSCGPEGGSPLPGQLPTGLYLSLDEESCPAEEECQNVGYCPIDGSVCQTAGTSSFVCRCGAGTNGQGYCTTAEGDVCCPENTQCALYRLADGTFTQYPECQEKCNSNGDICNPYLNQVCQNGVCICTDTGKPACGGGNLMQCCPEGQICDGSCKFPKKDYTVWFIVGGVLGVLFLIGIGFIIFLVIRKRRKREQDVQPQMVQQQMY